MGKAYSDPHAKNQCDENSLLINRIQHEIEILQPFLLKEGNNKIQTKIKDRILSWCELIKACMTEIKERNRSPADTFEYYTNLYKKTGHESMEGRCYGLIAEIANEIGDLHHNNTPNKSNGGSVNKSNGGSA